MSNYNPKTPTANEQNYVKPADQMNAVDDSGNVSDSSSSNNGDNNHQDGDSDDFSSQ